MRNFSPKGDLFEKFQVPGSGYDKSAFSTITSQLAHRATIIDSSLQCYEEEKIDDKFLFKGEPRVSPRTCENKGLKSK